MYRLIKHIVFLWFVGVATLLNFNNACAQNTDVSVSVLDELTGDPIQYANVLLSVENDTLMLLGGITNARGEVVIEDVSYGIYKLKISFIGYNKFVKEKVKVDSRNTDLGNIKLNINSENIGQIDVLGKKKGLYYKVDRKIITAESNPQASKAIDLLANIPSLQVDFEGRLSYRGDGTFEVYINGHPVTNGTVKLRQLSTDKIDYIEVITNPSAKYAAEGTAGIIQVILKRNRLEGFVLNSSVSISTLGGYEWLFNVDKKWERGGWYLEGQAGDDVLGKSKVTTEQFITNTNGIDETYSIINKKQRSKNTYVEFGFNYDLSDKDYIDLMLNVNPFKYSDNNIEDGFYEEKYYNNGELNNTEIYNYNSKYKMDYRYLGSVLTYEHAFSKDRSHLLTTFIDFSTYLNPLSEIKIDNGEYVNHSESMGYNDKEYNEVIVNYNLAYKVSVSEKSKLEVGTDVKLNRIPKYTSVSGTFDENEEITPFAWVPTYQQVDFKRNIYSGFMTFNSGFGKLEYMLGIRSEYTERAMNYSYVEENGASENLLMGKDFIDFFPTLHVVYNFSDEKQLSASYSSRINRPNYWSLVPMRRYESPHLLYIGNDELMPSYAKAMEIGFLKSWNDNFFSVEMFARNTKGLAQNYYRALADNNTIIYTKENVGNSWSVGSEFMTGIDVFSWWNTNVSTSLFTYQLKVDVDNDKRTEKQFRSDSGFNNTFNLGKTTLLKCDISYRSPMISAQVSRDSYWYSNMAIRKTFDSKKWAVLLSWSNVFNSRKYNAISKGDEFMVNSYFEKESFVTLKLSYSFDNQD